MSTQPGPPAAKPIHSKASAKSFGKVRSELAKAGRSQADITALIGNGANGRTRYEIAELLVLL